MVAMRRLILAFLVLYCAQMVMSQDTMTGVFDERIKSLQVRCEDDDFAAPVIALEAGGRIAIDFDILTEEREFLRYSLEHCDARWRPSGLVESEFLEGFNEGVIEDYQYSGATTVRYIHYSFHIPNEQITPTISGNYLLRVYNENDPDNILLQCRFMVSEQTAPISARVLTSTDIDYNDKHQQLEIAVDTERAQIEDIFNDMTIVVGQNGRLDSERAFKQPLRVSGKQAFFEHRPELIFEAGNEYRRMETVSNQYPGMGVDYIEYFSPYYHYVLKNDEPRPELPYSYDQTQHGRYFIREYNSDNSNVDADYGIVHFTLDCPEIPGTMIFLDGDFVQRRFDPNSQMQYNHNTGKYERSILLKQGAYNYQYLAVPPGAKRGFTSTFEGDHYQTSNEYLIKVYHRRRGERYDRLIGISAVSSGN